MGFDAGWWFGCCQPCHDIEDVFGAQAAALQYQLNGYQHGIESGDRYGSQDLRHDPVTAGMTPQAVLKLTQRHRQISKGRSVAQRAGLALNQRDVVLPVVADLVAIQQARMAGYQRIIGHHLDAGRIQTAADPLTRVLTRHRVAVAPDADQAGAGDPRRPLDVTVEWRWHRHQFSALQLQHFGHTQPAVLRVRQLVPKRAAALAQPGIEFLEGVKLAVLGV